MNSIGTLLESLLLAEAQEQAMTALDASNQPSVLNMPADAGSLFATNSWPLGGSALPGFLPGDVLGSVSGSVAGDQYTRIPNADNMPYLYQGNTNGCGSTSLAMVLNYYGIDVSRQDIDNSIRRVDNSIGATPEDELQYARDHGLDAEEYNNGTWDEVKSMIDQGYPVMASVTGQNIPEIPSGNLPDGRHQIVITGYETAADGTQYVLFHDPNYGSAGAEKKISLADFEKAWGQEDFGVKNFFMVFAPGGSNLPPSRMDGAQGAMAALNGAANVCNGWDRIFSPDNFGSFVHGIPEFFGGLVQTAGGGVGALLQLGAEKLRGLVDGIPVLQNIVEPFTDVVSGLGGAVADAFNGIGKAFNSVGGAFESLCNGDVGGFVSGLGNAAGNLVTGAANAVSDAASTVGNAISDFFSGW